MPISPLKTMESLVLVSQQNGVTVIPQPTPLTRLNYFDGKFLRASDLSAEQLYLRRLVDLSNQAGGPGVAYGYNLSLAAGGDTLNLGPGLAIDPQGRVLLLPECFSIGVQELIERSRQLKTSPTSASGGNGSFADCTVVAESPPAGEVQAGSLYLITIGFAEALCGQEDIFGKLCEEACATSTDRPFLVEGVILRAIPLQLQTPLPNSAVVALSQLHLRSRVASSYFEDERKRIASFISGDGLRSDIWCFGAEAAGGFDVPIGVLARAGNTTLFLDAWIARRERIDAPAKRYWQWRMAMRPWDVFLAQILQFQCQLSGLFKRTPQAAGDDDPCASTKAVIREASEAVATITAFYQTVSKSFTIEPILTTNTASAVKAPTLDLAALGQLQKRLQDSAATFIPGDQILIDGGIIELPSAGYLPVLPNAVITVNEQVRRLMGKGVGLRFCIVRPDFVAHALEEAQHMERISLLQGLDDTKRKPKIDILVPNGEIIEEKGLSIGLGFEAQLDVIQFLFYSFARTTEERAFVNQYLRFEGAARAEELPSGGGAVYLGAEFVVEAGVVSAVGGVGPTNEAGVSPTPGIVNLAASRTQNLRFGAWVSLVCEKNVFVLTTGDTSNFNAQAIVAATEASNARVLEIVLNGIVEITQPASAVGGARTLKGHIEGAQLTFRDFQGGSRETTSLGLDVTIKLTGSSAVEIVLAFQEASFQGTSLTLTANWDKQPLEVIASIKAKTRLEDLVIAAATLKENADVLSASNANHQQALDALDIVGQALGEVPTFAAAKARLLFPPPPPPIDEITVRGTADWVLFHRRRDKQCTSIIAPQKPPLSYRVLNNTVKTLDEARKFAEALNANPAALGTYIKKEWRTQPELFIRYAGNSAQPLFDFADVDQKWKLFNPGELIAFAWYGSRDDDNQALQTNRLYQFESAISGSSREYGSTQRKPVSSFPPGTLPLDADGIMLFITLRQTYGYYGYYGVSEEGIGGGLV